jgi:predicted dehydrogenase
VGAGAIVTSSHLPAYTNAGYRIVAIYDRNPDSARAAAAQFGIPHVCASLQELLADVEVSIVDMAVPPLAQPEMARAVMAAGKHLLCQKPLAWTLEEATKLVDEASRAGIKLAVNQQMRWDPMIRETRKLQKAGVLGKILNVSLDESVQTDWAQWTWIPPASHLDLMLHSIHYFDSLRYLFGEPDWVFSTIGKFPGQKEVAETRSYTTFSFPDELIVRINVHHNNWTDDQVMGWRVEGTTGIIRGRFGHLDNYPHGGPDVMEYTLRDETVRGETTWHKVEIADRWFPDAFAGPMGSLIRAIEQGGEAETNGRDNLKTLGLVFACYRSAAECRPVDPQEATQNPPKIRSKSGPPPDR